MKGVDCVGDDIISLRRGLCQLGVTMGMRAGGGRLMVQGASQGSIGCVHVMSAWLLRLSLGSTLSHHLGTERIYHSRLAGPSSCLGHKSRGPRSGAWATRVKGRCTAMETTTAVTTTSNTAVAQINWKGLLVMVVRSAVAISIVAAADYSTWGRQGIGSLYGTAGLLERQCARVLRCWMMHMMEKMVSIVMPVLTTACLL